MKMVSFSNGRNEQWHHPDLYPNSLCFDNIFTRIHTILFSLSDDFPESTGVKRIVQALNANVWSSVEMKDGKMT